MRGGAELGEKKGTSDRKRRRERDKMQQSQQHHVILVSIFSEMSSIADAVCCIDDSDSLSNGGVCVCGY